MDIRNRTLQEGDFYPSRLGDIEGCQTRPRSWREFVCFRETEFKIHRVTKQAEKQNSLQSKTYVWDSRSWEAVNRRGFRRQLTAEVLKTLFHVYNCKRTQINSSYIEPVIFVTRTPLHVTVLWRIDPLLVNDSVNTFPRESARLTVGHPLLGNWAVNISF
jgi:hypothetical protein